MTTNFAPQKISNCTLPAKQTQVGIVKGSGKCVQVIFKLVDDDALGEPPDDGDAREPRSEVRRVNIRLKNQPREYKEDQSDECQRAVGGP